MFVTVDYLVVYSEEMDLMEFLTEMLKNALEDVDDEPPDEEELREHMNIRYTKRREDFLYICGFSVEFDSAGERMSELIDNFSEAVVDCEDKGIRHILKLNDPQLRRTLRAYGDEIFEIEMKLREALSLIFVNTYGDDYYTLLKDVSVEPRGKKAPQESQMQSQHENQFFFLQFNDYINVNVRKQLNLARIKEYIEQVEDFEGLKRMITTNPITNKPYADFLASLKERVDSIEQLRNCVAHNRSISTRTLDNYKRAKDQLLESIEEFLEKQASHNTATGD